MVRTHARNHSEARARLGCCDTAAATALAPAGSRGCSPPFTLTPNSPPAPSPESWGPAYLQLQRSPSGATRRPVGSPSSHGQASPLQRATVTARAKLTRPISSAPGHSPAAQRSQARSSVLAALRALTLTLIFHSRTGD